MRPIWQIRNAIATPAATRTISLASAYAKSGRLTLRMSLLATSASTCDTSSKFACTEMIGRRQEIEYAPKKTAENRTIRTGGDQNARRKIRSQFTPLTHAFGSASRQARRETLPLRASCFAARANH
jgi:hypothetical protein